jgi:hypothetical protein
LTWSGGGRVRNYQVLEDASGGSAYSIVASGAPDSGSVELERSMPDHVNGRYKLSGCGDIECEESESVLLGDELVTSARLSGGRRADADSLLLAASADGGTLAMVERHRDDHANLASAGHPESLHVFVRETNRWIAQSLPAALQASSGSWQWRAVALSSDGNMLVAERDSPIGQVAADERGAEILIYVRSGGQWRLEGQLSRGAEPGSGCGQRSAVALGSRSE